LAPYLYLLVAEALSLAVRHSVAIGTLRGIRLPDQATQQILTQYADDTTLSLFGSNRFLTATFDLLNDFGIISRLTINRRKCAIYFG
jgi:hypothetical protein